MKFKELTYAETYLLASVLLGAVLLTVILILCIIWKRCWIHKYLWKDEKLKSSEKKPGKDDIICIRYPPDIYPTSVGVYRENIIRSPEDELARLFRCSPIKRDSTYSSMSDGSNASGSGGGRASASTYELANSPQTTSTIGVNNLSPTTTTASTNSPSSSISPDSSTAANSMSPLLIQRIHSHHLQQQQQQHDSTHTHNNTNQHLEYLETYLQLNNNISSPPPVITHTSPTTTNDGLNNMSQQFSEHQVHLIHNNNKQSFFTFALKFEEEDGKIHIDFIEARNLPPREYLNLPCDVFFTIEIQPKRHVVESGRKASSAALSLASALSSAGTRTFGKSFTSLKHHHQQQQQGEREMNSSKNEPASSSSTNTTTSYNIPPHYRFVTKTLKKVLQTCDFSETFLAQLSRTHMKDYFIRFTAFDQDRFGNPTELGSTTLTFDDFNDFTQHKLILSCSLKDPIIKLGEIQVGLCHLPTAERVSISIIKVMNLNPYLSHGLITKQSICYVRVLLLRADTGKVLKRKKTTYQRCLGNSSSDQQPQFNETLVFDMPPNELLHSVLLVLVCITNKIPMGSGSISHGSSPTGTMACMHPPVSAFKRHSTPETSFPYPMSGTIGLGHPLAPPPTNSQARHSIGESLFHFSDNLNIKQNNNNGVNSAMNNNTSQSKTSINETPASASSPSSLTYTKDSKDRVVGKMALGYTIRNAKGKCHWEQMVRNPRNVFTEWHALK